MNYEIMHGDLTCFQQEGNEYAACLEALKDEAYDDNIQAGPFMVTALPYGETQKLDMGLVLRLRVMASNPSGGVDLEGIYSRMRA